MRALVPLVLVAVAVQKSADELDTYIACGEVPDRDAAAAGDR